MLRTFLLLVFAFTACAETPYFTIKVVDAQTGRGVPLVELETVSHVRFVTDNAGLVAFNEPSLMDRAVFLHVRSHGYEFPKDGFGFAGTALTPRAGSRAELKITRRNIAERLYRITGEGLYRDTILAGEKPPLREPLLNAQVVGQDSTQAAVYRGKIFWLWGDTSRASYPLGNFATSGATSELPAHGGLPAATGIDLRYFADEHGFARAMWPRPEHGVVWTDGLLVVKDRAGEERLVAHYEHREGLAKLLDHGLGAFDEAAGVFKKIAALPAIDAWHSPRGHPTRVSESDGEFFYSGTRDTMFPCVRVKAAFEDVQNPAAYEAWTCLSDGAHFDGKKTRLERDASGHALYAWKRNADPLTAAQERELIDAAVLREDEARYQPRDIEAGKTVRFHAGSVRWNDFRKKWIAIAGEHGGTSLLGEVWFSEADSPLGPWRRARKIVTHDRYSFYNVVQHDFLDEEGGRFIYFEGTYTHDFSGNPDATPRYEYNQIMYRLDLADERLRLDKP